MSTLPQTLVDGVRVGSLYALIALGYTMVYGILQFINFAHGDVVMTGAWIAYCVASAAGLAINAGAAPVPGWTDALLLVLLAGVLILCLPRARTATERFGGRFNSTLQIVRVVVVSAAILRWVYMAGVWLVHLTAAWGGGVQGYSGGSGGSGRLVPAAIITLLTCMALCAICGYNIERLAYRPLKDAPRLNVLITAIGVSLLIENLGQLHFLFGTEPQPMPPLLPDSLLGTIAGARIQLVDVIIVAATLLLMVALDVLVYHTKFGLAMRAISFNRDLAALMGVPVERVVSLTFIVGSALAAAGGFLYASKYHVLNQSADTSWILLGLKAFVAAVVGGIGNIRGAMLGGLLIGLIEKFGVAYLHPNLAEVYVFVLLIAVLLIKPSGILGHPVMEKV